ncbi:GspH/FimT family pseudopilin [Allochromatium palmeri]|uniref:Type II secretion system protein H n=1 Tax=Allochromatium palmeri TaxID=231048 RepID=A0A6N8EH39_9GAMM|nr:GspH/FimT family pseudopilin [Allochromatium palmeri]MTW21807.1 prepilin-type N-terminal cleavage/methylation domain-containing protein [Allochromatium palmeri]
MLVRLARGRLARMRGVTLLELLIVIAILGLLLGVALPAMQDLIERNRLKAAAHALAEDLQWARSEAIKRNRPLGFSIDTGHWCYGVAPEESGCDCRRTPGVAGSCSLKRVLGDAFPGVRLESTLSLTRFEPRRATAINGSLTLTSPSGSSLKVVLSRLGRVRFCTPTQDLAGYDACG